MGNTIKASELRRELKKTFPSLSWPSKIYLFDPLYEMPEYNEVKEIHDIIWKKLSPLKDKALSLGWRGSDCDDFAEMVAATLKFHRLNKQKASYLPWAHGWAVGKVKALQGWQMHAFNVFLCKSGLYISNYSNIKQPSSNYKPKLVKI